MPRARRGRPRRPRRRADRHWREGAMTTPPRRPNQPPPTWESLDWAAVGPRDSEGMASLQAEIERARMELRLGRREEARGRLLRVRKAIATAIEPRGGR